MNVMTTLAEDSYFLGMAALLNSTVHFGGNIDLVVVGYRNQLPDWLPELTQSKFGQSFTTRSGLVVDLIELTGDMHIVHEKPKWMLYVTEVLAPRATNYFFFDSDIIINARMTFFQEWAERGVAVSGDVNFIFDRTHPLRRAWASFAADRQRPVLNAFDGYYNSGFLGWSAENTSFIDDWNEAFSILLEHSADTKEFRVFDRTHAVMSTNQDSLNLAMMITERPLSAVGPEAMGFIHGMRLMFHPIGEKPWKRNNLLNAFKGHPPRDSDVAFWRFANGTEFSPYNSFTIQFKLFICQFLRFMGRFYHVK